MNLYRLIKEKELVNETLSPVLFGNPRRRDAILNQITALERPMHGVCLFYTALIELDILNKAIRESKPIKDCCSESIWNTLELKWNGSLDLTDSLSVFSFLNDCIDENDRYFGDSIRNVLSRVRSEYDSFLRYDLKTRSLSSLFEELLSNLPLLKEAKLDIKNKTIDLGSGPICFEPLIYVSEKNGTPALDISISISKGEQNNQLKITTTDPFDQSINHKKKDRMAVVANDERLRLICDTYEISTTWYSLDSYLGNCSFVVKLSNVLSRAICESIRQRIGAKNRINEYVQQYFTNTPIHIDIRSEINSRGSSSENQWAFQNYMLGLIIREGAFSTTYCLLLGNGSSDELAGDHVDFEKVFENIVSIIREEKYCSDEKMDELMQGCELEISAHMEQLKLIISDKSKSYIRRVDQIRAEQKAQCILEMIGLRHDNLFIDQERMLSIYDYFEMVFNNSVSLAAIIRNATSFVMRYYAHILSMDVELPKTDNPVDILSSFKEFCMQTEGSKALDNAIGRKCICNMSVLEDYIENFKKVKSWDSDGVDKITKKYFFVSYAHSDKPRVDQFVNKWRSQGFNFFVDDSFDIGEEWIKRARNEIKDPLCEGVLLFLSERSTISEAVIRELEIANARIKGSPESSRSFIIPIRMVDAKDVSALLKAEERDISDDERDRIVYFRKIVNENVISIGMDDDASLKDLFKNRLANMGLDYDLESMNDAERATETYLAFLKTGKFFDEDDLTNIEETVLKSEESNHCIYPLLLSVKETRIKRDNVAILAYELVNGKGNENIPNRVMLSDNAVPANDYYCVPNIKSCGECGEWMTNPALVSFDELRSDN